MKRLFLIVPLAMGLAACAPPIRVGPPAPIVTVGRPMPPSARPHPQLARPSAPRKSVEVYPYRPSPSAPDATTPKKTATKVEKPQTEPISEPATKRLTKTKAAASRSTPPRVRVAHAPPPPAPSLPPAVTTLLKQAEQQRQARDYVSTAALLERALGIQPQAPSIWNRLARVRVEQGRYAQAANLAKRSNALAGAGQQTLKRDNWAIIAAARKAAGDTAGAARALRNARGG